VNLGERFEYGKEVRIELSWIGVYLAQSKGLWIGFNEILVETPTKKKKTKKYLHLQNPISNFLLFDKSPRSDHFRNRPSLRNASVWPVRGFCVEDLGYGVKSSCI
jgi:hypothetical protein